MSIGWYTYFTCVIIYCLFAFIAYYVAKKKLAAICFAIVIIWIIFWLIVNPYMLFWPFQDLVRGKI